MDKAQNDNGTETSKNQIVHPEATSNGDNPSMQDKVLDHSSSSSSSSSSSNPFDLDTNEKDPLKNSFSKSEQSPIPDLPSSPDHFATTPQWSMMSETPRAGSGRLNFSQSDFMAQEWAAVNASPKQSPPVQVMGRPPGYDPNRIPLSVFSTKPTTPTEWSAASNESLFSIQMGNSSFSRTHSILLGKSGELNNSPYMVKNDSKTGDLNSLPTVIEAAGENGGRNASIDYDDVYETQNVGSKRSASGDDEKKLGPTQVGSTTAACVGGEGGRNSASTPRLSDESGNSASSFAFPVLGGQGGSLKAVAEKPGSHAEEKTQTEAGTEQKKEQEKTQTEAGTEQKKEQGEPQSPVSTPKALAGGNKWFKCLTCCPLCC